MRHVFFLPSRRLLNALPLLAGVGACAYSIPEVNPVDIPRIQTEIAARPTDTNLQVQLGMAQFKAGDFGAALAALQGAVDAGDESGPALLYLGMTHEERTEWSEARDAYSRYLQVGRSSELVAEVRRRLGLVAQNVLQQQARQALDQESQLTGAAPTPRSVAVMPFAFNSDRPEYEPLIYAISDMMITDFAVSNALVVLERSQIQTLLDEMALTEAGYAEPATGARTGRMLQAEHVVQGVLTTLGQDELQIDTDVLNVASTSSAGQQSATNQIANLFEMEKDLVFDIISNVLGVQLTPAEEQRIRDNRTDNVLAFLAYGRGLREKDRGNFAAAATQFQQAADLDPNFDAAAQAATDAAAIGEAAGVSTTDMATRAGTTGETGTSGGIAPPTNTATTTQTTLSGVSEAVNPTPTTGTLDLGSTATSSGQTQAPGQSRGDAVQESQGSEAPASAASARIRIVIRRPGGAQ